MISNPDCEFFFRQCAAHARTLPIVEAGSFLRGMLQTVPDSPALVEIRRINNDMATSDHQLELIETGQMKLNFGAAKKKASHFSK